MLSAKTVGGQPCKHWLLYEYAMPLQLLTHFCVKLSESKGVGQVVTHNREVESAK